MTTSPQFRSRAIDDRRPGVLGAVAGIAGAARNAAVALIVNGELRAFCEQERISRVRNVGLADRQLPAEALDAVLAVGGLDRASVTHYATAEELELPAGLPVVRVDHHRAHAAAAFALSGFDAAAVLVCDQHSREQTSVWIGTADGVTRAEWFASDVSLAARYSEAARLFGYPPRNEHQLEALARLAPQASTDGFEDRLRWENGRLQLAPDWTEWLASRLAAAEGQTTRGRAAIAGGFQRHVAALLQRMLYDVRQQTNAAHLCLAGGLFYNTSLATAIRQAGLFDAVFVPPNPGNAGAAIGAALVAAGADGSGVRGGESPFLGPEYDLEEIKRTLENCKLSAECLTGSEVIDVTAQALARGHLVGWLQGRMEWGHRALGNRSILANPMSPYVLDNLNVFLKHRERHRAYGVSTLEERAAELFDGPPTSRFMEFEYRPRDRDRFARVMPDRTATLRVQTVPHRPGDEATARFRRLLARVDALTGVPVLVNTSFNGFAEPIVCSPRDAIRVFFGTGLDMLVMDRFVIRK